MIIASNISHKLNYLSQIDFLKIKSHFLSNGLPIKDKKMFDKKMFEIILKDKKNIDNKINFVLLKSIGNAFLKNNLNVKNIKKIIN